MTKRVSGRHIREFVGSQYNFFQRTLVQPSFVGAQLCLLNVRREFEHVSTHFIIPTRYPCVIPKLMALTRKDRSLLSQTLCVFAVLSLYQSLRKLAFG